MSQDVTGLAGFAAAVDLDLVLDDQESEPCLWNECNAEAVYVGVISTPCGCPQPVCLRHKEVENARWQAGDEIWCYFCRPNTVENAGEFLRWERVRR